MGDTKMRFYAALDKRVVKAFDKVVGVSGEVADELRKYAGDARTVKIDNGVDVTRFSGSISRDDAKIALSLGKRPVVGFVGRLTSDKGVSYLLRSARLLKDQGVELEVLIVGEGDFSRALHDEAVHLGIAEQVRFLGRREDMPRVYAAMDVLVLPSLKEAFPMVVLEAMAAGIPVIATRVGDVPYILNEGECGVLVEQENALALSDAIRNLIGDQAAMRRVALSGQRRARERFSSEAMATRYRELYAQAWAERYAG
jgi:glycosyltransferase involved in cell wall biosynthesis